MVTIVTVYPDFGIGRRYNEKIRKQTVTKYGTLINEGIFKNDTLFSAVFHRINTEDQRSHENE